MDLPPIVPVLAAAILVVLPAVPAAVDMAPDDRLSPSEVDALRSGDPVTLVLGAEPVTLTAHPDPVLDPDADVVLLAPDGTARSTDRPDPATYSGEVAEHPDAIVRLVLDDRPRGIVSLPGGATWILTSGAAGTATAVPLAEAPVGRMPTDDAVPAGDEPVTTEADMPPELAGTLELRIALESSSTFWIEYPNTWDERLLEIAHLAEGLYRHQIGVNFTVTWMGTWTSTDPYPNGAGRDTLDDLRDYWEANRDHVPRDVVHLANGRIINGFRGRAFISALNTSYAYGVEVYSQYHTTEVDQGLSLYENGLLLAHELGHNFDAWHQRSVSTYGITGDPDDLYTGPGTVMNGGQTPLPRFSELDHVVSPFTGWELDNEEPMRTYAEQKLHPLAG